MRTLSYAQRRTIDKIRPTPPRALSYLPTTAFVLDAAVLVGVGFTAAACRTWLGWFQGSLSIHATLLVAPGLLAVWLLVTFALGGYRESIFGAGIGEYKIMANATLLSAGLTSGACYLLSINLSRSFFVLTYLIGVLLLIAERALLRRALHKARRLGVLRHEVLIAGTPGHVDEIARVLSRETWLGYRVLGALVPDAEHAGETRRGVPVLGTPDQALAVLAASGADTIFIAGGALDSADQMRALVWDLEHENVQVVVAPSVTDVARERIRMRPVGGLPLVHIDPPRSMAASRRAKRTFDVVLSTMLLLFLAPVFLVCALHVRRHDRGPVFFRQVRTGQNGCEFSCLKFRTMVLDAEAQLARLKVQVNHTGGLFKMREDPRITTPGRWLRRFSLDELPQLVNVFRGDMSLVGPRPQLPSEVAGYDRFTHRRLHVRPGMTGLWQVSGRSDLSWDEAVRLDLYYVDNWSMLQDLAILVKTLGAVTGSRGAY